MSQRYNRTVITTDLEERRLKKGLRQEDVARAAGISRVAYTNIENGKRRPSPEVAQKIAKVLKFKWTLFFTEWKYPGNSTDDDKQSKEEPA